MKRYPNWVEKHHIAGTSIKQIGDNYYLYSVTSKTVKDKPYPVSIQKYIGKITKEGLIKPESISFTPSRDKLGLLKDCISLEKFTVKEKEIIGNLPVLIANGNYYTGKVTGKVEKILVKHLNYKDGVIYE